MKPLLFIPSPRDIEIVKESVDKLKIDKLWLKYYPQEEAYVTARDWFLRHYEYTHLIIHPDDLLATQTALEFLLLSADDKVISGWCINTIKENWEQINDTSISYTLCWDPPRSATYESFNFIPAQHINTLLSDGKAIIKVKFSGFALCCIPRNILEQVMFRGDQDCCMDATFAIDLHYYGIDQYCNLKTRTKHLRRSKEEIQVDKKPKRIIFEGK